ncbi:VOC family protein [Massilia sp. TS11]|uniref:VOC family protein n=1 Tax=Massilia sp. TS11 TaxID=2908003 RepID=UPI001EDC00A0|nr:VOC family protein [Massilia sp. TS11]MCG2586814.1 VOC family protein [Massilia sp. TS11]
MRRLLLATIMLLSLSARAADAPFIALSVADLGRSLTWYRDHLGFSVYSQGEVKERGIRFALLKKDAALLELLQLPAAQPRTGQGNVAQASLTHGFFKAGMVVDDLDGLYQSLKSQGVPIAIELGKPAGGPYRVFGVYDPEGNLLQFFGK